MKRSTSSGSNNSGLENFIGVVDSSDTYYNFDLNQNQNKIVFRNYNRNISCSPASLYGQVSYGALYPGSYRDENSIISKSNSIAVVAGYIRTQRLLINLKEYFNPSLQNRRTIYTVYNPYPIPIKIFYSRYINQYDFDVNHGLHYFSEDVWPWICQKGYFNCSLTGHQMPITRNYVISNASVTINPYSSSDITVDIYCEYSTNEELTYNYISLAYSLGNFENPFPYNSSSLFMDKVNFSDGGDNNTGSFNILYSLPANTITGNTSFEYKSCF